MVNFFTMTRTLRYNALLISWHQSPQLKLVSFKSIVVLFTNFFSMTSALILESCERCSSSLYTLCDLTISATVVDTSFCIVLANSITYAAPTQNVQKVNQTIPCEILNAPQCLIFIKQVSRSLAMFLTKQVRLSSSFIEAALKWLQYFIPWCICSTPISIKFYHFFKVIRENQRHSRSHSSFRQSSFLNTVCFECLHYLIKSAKVPPSEAGFSFSKWSNTCERAEVNTIYSRTCRLQLPSVPRILVINGKWS